ncbi:MAG: class I SAM-dependent methyltransferase [Euryarchaeota archaeon]|jgi:predicted O-methyltransferase YrrM/predicted transcriptional regulator|uniref:methyltransferase family protein n=1 Tax=Methanobacterium sp. MZD130B TaxID=3394378 RepID=UPI0017555BD5|nr:class I SAM-dependent methyltransferase [Euryarchaeota archaeon]HHT18870.1 methyltransferase type 12 [Methanobacterium sp.]
MNKNANIDLKNDISQIDFPEEISMIDSIMDGYKYYQMIYSALKLGFFDKMIEMGPASPREIAETASVNGMFVRSILSALEDISFVKSDEDGYMLTEQAETFLSKKSLFYQGDLIMDLGRDESPWNDLETVLERKGSPKLIQKEVDELQIRSLAQQCIRGEVQNVLRGIVSRPEFSEHEKLLDIGGSHGLYSIGLCQENNALSATIIEHQEVVPLTSSSISEYWMDDRITVQEGDIENLKAVPEDGYDIILLSHQLYQYRRKMDETLEKIVEMLNPGGTLVLNHRFCSPQCEIKPGDGIREIDRALTSFGHPLCHPEGLKDVLEKIGFVNVSLIPHETALGYAVLCIGTKEGKPLEKTLDAEKKLVSNYSSNGEDRCC